MKMMSAWPAARIFFCFLLGFSLLMAGCTEPSDGQGAGPWDVGGGKDTTGADVSGADVAGEDGAGADGQGLEDAGSDAVSPDAVSPDAVSPDAVSEDTSSMDVVDPDASVPDPQDAQGGEDGRDEEDGSEPLPTGRVGASPTLLEFEGVEIGTQQRKSLSIQNLGGVALRISAITLHEDRGGSFDDERELFTAGTGWSSEPMVLAAGASHQVDVTYRPINAQADQGAVIIASDDPLTPELRVPIVTRGSEPEDPNPILHAPTKVVWTRLSPVVPGAGQPPWAGNWKMIELKNIGNAPLRITDMYVSGSTRFYFTIPQTGGGAGGDDDVDSDTMSWPQALAPGHVLKVRMWFRPVDDSPQSGLLVLESNDADTPVREVQLLGNQGAACLSLTPAAQLSFGSAAIGAVSQRTVTLHNCSAATNLSISDIRVTDTDGGAFGILSGSLPGVLPRGNHVLRPGETVTFGVTFSPTAERSYEGEVTVTSDDPVTPQYRLRVEGIGTDNRCPTAIATGTILGDSSNRASSHITAPPLSTIKFDGSSSVDPDGSIARYEWTLLSKPRDSNQVIRGASTAAPTLYLDVLGEYRVELRVYDDQGTVSCGTPAIVTITAATHDDIRIELVWETPGHPQNNSGGGSDLDLHYLHPNATRWNLSPWDCYWANKQPDWGIIGDPSDNPVLEIDTIDGRGPEVITHSGLEGGAYTVGVHYYSDHGYGPSFATVRIYKNGVEEFVFEDKYLSHKQMWEVASIQGGTLAITMIDTVSVLSP